MNTNSINISNGKITENEGFIWRPKWFLITRFFAVIGVAIALLVSDNLFHIETIHYPALWTLTAILFISNLFYLIIYKKSCFNDSSNETNLVNRLTFFTLIQINADLIILTLMLHFGGGATNPFVFYYFFHTILSSILLSKKAAYSEALVVALLFNSMTILEGFNIIRHYAITSSIIYTNGTFIMGMCFALTSALFIAVYMATSIMERLKKHQNELLQALEETERLEIEKSHILDVVVHDLKSPLASIETMVTSTLSVYGDIIPPKVKQILERIPYRTNSLIKFIRELLDFSGIKKIDQIQVQFTLLNFIPIVTSIVEMHKNQALDKNISIILNSEPEIPVISGNKDHLERMVANLLSNAIMYTPENGSVHVKISSENDEVILTVADRGIGIPEDAIPQIFNDFFRAKNARKVSSSGTGMGLSITKAIFEKQGGTISVKSTENKGTVFTVQLPCISS